MNKRGAVNSSPLPLSVLHQPLFSLLSCLTSYKRRPIRALGRPHFLPSPSPPHSPLYISRQYVQQSVQCAAREQAGSVQRNSQTGRERRECEWISALTHKPSSDTVQLFLLRSFHWSPVDLFSFFYLFLLLQTRADYKRNSSQQHCSLVSGTGPHHQDGLYIGPLGLPTSVPGQLRAGGPVAGCWWCQSSWSALLSGAPVSGHWRHGEILVPLHLSVWNHLLGDWCSRNGCDLHL